MVFLFWLQTYSEEINALQIKYMCTVLLTARDTSLHPILVCATDNNSSVATPLCCVSCYDSVKYISFDAFWRAKRHLYLLRYYWDLWVSLWGPSLTWMHFLSKFFFLCLNSNRHYFWRSTAIELRKRLWDVWIWFKIVFEHFQNMHWSTEELGAKTA